MSTIKGIKVSTIFGTVEYHENITFRPCYPVIIKIKRFLRPSKTYLIHVGEQGITIERLD